VCYDRAWSAGRHGEELMEALRLKPEDQLVDVVLPGANHPQRDHLGAAIFQRVGDSNGVLVHVETNEQLLARLAHG
jgi:hypothetical protein